MIRMIQSSSSAHAKAYFADALAKPDYYVSDQELPGYWQGRLAGRLGVSGTTSKDDFFALCENIHPRTGKRLTPRVKANRRTGYDINFHCPKSVSILHVLSSDDHIL
ncbi:MAG: relaxase domain-containing protein, partial [Bacteroidota bacterium]